MRFKVFELNFLSLNIRKYTEKNVKLLNITLVLVYLLYLIRYKSKFPTLYVQIFDVITIIIILIYIDVIN